MSQPESDTLVLPEGYDCENCSTLQRNGRPCEKPQCKDLAEEVKRKRPPPTPSSAPPAKKRREWRQPVPAEGDLPPAEDLTPPADLNEQYEHHQLVAAHWSVGTYLAVSWLCYVLNRFRRQIRTFYNKGPLCRFFNIRLRADPLNGSEVIDNLRAVFDTMKTAFKFNVGFAIVLVHSETREARFFHVGGGTENLLFPEARMVKNRGEYDGIFDTISTMDLIDHFEQRRENTKLKFHRALSMRVQCYPLPGHVLLGAPVQLPKHIRNSKALRTLLRNENSKPYRLDDCFFRCLMFHLNKQTIPRGSQEKINQLKQEYVEKCDPPNFDGRVTLQEMCQLEAVFNVRVSIYKCGPLKSKPDELAAKAIRITPLRTADNGHMRLDLSGRHLSYITHLERYAQSWVCNKCSKFVCKKRCILNRHVRVCSGTIQRRPKYPRVNRVIVTPNLFTKLERRGIVVLPTQRSAKLFSCYDLESYGANAGTAHNTDSTTLLNRQVAFAASVTSNVEGFEEPIVILNRDGDQEQLVSDLIEYFLKVSRAARRQEYHRMASILEQIDAQMEEHLTASLEPDKDRLVVGYHEQQLKELTYLKERLETTISRHTIFSFNGARSVNTVCQVRIRM